MHGNNWHFKDFFTTPIETWYYFVNVRNCIYDRLQF